MILALVLEGGDVRPRVVEQCVPLRIVEGGRHVEEAAVVERGPAVFGAVRDVVVLAEVGVAAGSGAQVAQPATARRPETVKAQRFFSSRAFATMLATCRRIDGLSRRMSYQSSTSSG